MICLTYWEAAGIAVMALISIVILIVFYFLLEDPEIRTEQNPWKYMEEWDEENRGF